MHKKNKLHIKTKTRIKKLESSDVFHTIYITKKQNHIQVLIPWRKAPSEQTKHYQKTSACTEKIKIKNKIQRSRIVSSTIRYLSLTPFPVLNNQSNAHSHSHWKEPWQDSPPGCCRTVLLSSPSQPLARNDNLAVFITLEKMYKSQKMTQCSALQKITVQLCHAKEAAGEASQRDTPTHLQHKIGVVLLTDIPGKQNKNPWGQPQHTFSISPSCQQWQRQSI